ncbi:MAG: hypothetical protein AAF211_07565 [Myxococcota bacterium]
MHRALLVSITMLFACDPAPTCDLAQIDECVTLTIEECESWAARVVGDPGDGSTRRDGCPVDEDLLGPVRFGIEGGICCR